LEVTNRGFVTRVNRPGERVELLSGQGYLFWGVEFIIVSALIWFGGARGKFNWVFIAFAALVSLVLASFGGRARIGIFWLTLAIVHVILNRRVKLIRFISLLIMLVIFMIGFIVWRQGMIESGGMINDALLLNIFTSDAWRYYLLHIFVTFENFIALLDVTPSYLPFDFGFNLIQPIVQIIPRAFWADKPADVGNILRAVIYPDLPGGTPFTFLGNLYLAFGFIGIVAGMTLLGFLLRALYEYISRRVEREEIVLLYGLAMSELFLMLWGEYLGAVTSFLEISLPLVIGMKWARKISRL